MRTQRKQLFLSGDVISEQLIAELINKKENLSSLESRFKQLITEHVQPDSKENPLEIMVKRLGSQ